MIKQKATVTYVTYSNQRRRQPLAHRPHFLAWRALTAIPGDLLAISRFRPSAIPGPGSTTLRTRSVTDEDSTRYAQWLQPHCPLIYAPGLPAGRSQP